MNLNKRLWLCALIPVVMPFFKANAADDIYEEVLVEASFYERSASDTANSLSLISAETLTARKAAHLEDVLNLMPNVNFSAGASRGRFFQIRGIGERSQFVDPINPSVGLIIDGIDFTGIGGAATTLDTKQVEVLRGPQGTLYGANALAGLINIVSAGPDEEVGEVRVTVGNFGTREASVANSFTLSDQLGLRVALGQNISDGYIRNTHLNRDDTNDIDETTFRAKLHWQLNNENVVKFTSFFVDTDNGYDAFSLDNTRETLSDEPGRDTLLSRAGAIQHVFSGFDFAEWETTLSFANSDSEYGFDEDWSYFALCLDFDCLFDPYASADHYNRNNRNVSFDTRLVSDSESSVAWVAGAYLRKQSVDLLRARLDGGLEIRDGNDIITNPTIEAFASTFDTLNAALYGQLDFPLTDSLTVSAGLRAERREADYEDSNAETIENDEDLWGGKLALEYRGVDNQLFYALISRGYKAGGNNVPASVGGSDNGLIPVIFDTEFLWNYELGHKATIADGLLETQLSVFYQDRKDMQVRQSVVTSQATGEVNGPCPCNFNDFLGNAAAGETFGLELEVYAYLSERSSAWFNLGLLDAEFDGFESASHIEADPQTGQLKDLDGRDVAHAPNYQAAAGVQVELSSAILFRLESEFKDAFFISSRNEEKTDSYMLLNSRLSYVQDDWELALWGKNLTDEDVIVRGFGSFGNDPRNGYETQPYYQFGAPRTWGVSAALRF